MASRPASVTVNQLGHSFTTDWSSDKNHHWHAATCGHDAVADKAEHFYDGGTCECGAEEEDPVYRVTVAPNNESYGTVTGSGSYTFK